MAEKNVIVVVIDRCCSSLLLVVARYCCLLLLAIVARCSLRSLLLVARYCCSLLATYGLNPYALSKLTMVVTSTGVVVTCVGAIPKNPTGPAKIDLVVVSNEEVVNPL